MNRLVSIVGGVMVMAFVASATPVDFSSDAFKGANNKSSFTSEYYGITLTASPKGAKLTQSKDGIGIDGLIDLTPNEINGSEVLTISFGRDVNLESVYISNLYTEGFIIVWQESGIYELSSGEIGQFVSGNKNGELTLDINKTVSSISLYTRDPWEVRYDFSVKGVNFTSVPEPAVLSMLGISLLGLCFVRNRKK
jgi:hypothetical protein